MVSLSDLAVLVNHQLILGWGLNRQVSCHFTLKDTIDIAGRAAHQIDRREFRRRSARRRARIGVVASASPTVEGDVLSSGAQFVPTSLRRYGASNYTEESGVEIL
jgi:hypothetical protein